MIRSFADSATEQIWFGQRIKTLPPDVQDRALKRLRMLNRARTLDGLQTDYELLEARRALNGELDRIVPRDIPRAA